MEIDITLETEEEKRWYEENMESVVNDAIFATGATVMVDGWYIVFEGYNNAYHTPKTNLSGDIRDKLTQTKLTGDNK